jgi:hypothetical protein
MRSVLPESRHLPQTEASDDCGRVGRGDLVDAPTGALEPSSMKTFASPTLMRSISTLHHLVRTIGGFERHVLDVNGNVQLGER